MIAYSCCSVSAIALEYVSSMPRFARTDFNWGCGEMPLWRGSSSPPRPNQIGDRDKRDLSAKTFALNALKTSHYAYSCHYSSFF